MNYKILILLSKMKNKHMKIKTNSYRIFKFNSNLKRKKSNPIKKFYQWVLFKCMINNHKIKIINSHKIIIENIISNSLMIQEINL